jgi:hypothetical protein
MNYKENEIRKIETGAESLANKASLVDNFS